MTSFVGRVYKITSSQTTDVYIGSTVQCLIERLCHHKTNHSNYVQGNYHYVTSFKILKYPDAKIELLYEGNFDTRQDLSKMEGCYIRSVDNCINKCVAGRSKKEYAEDRKDHLRIKNKEYRDNHKDELNIKSREYYMNHKDELKQKNDSLNWV